jgi:hypothetical protein
MAVITDYGTLKSAVQTWAARTDTTFGNQVPMFVEMAEHRLYNGAGSPGDEVYSPALRSLTMEVSSTLTMTAGEGAMPANVLEVRRVYRVGDQYGMTYEPPERFQVFLANNSGSADGLYYTVEAGTIKIAPPDSDNIGLVYYRSYDAITPTNTTGPLLEAHGGLYLSACLFEAFTFIQDANLAGGHLMRLRSQIAAANRTAATQRMPGPKRIRVRNPIP